MAARRAPLRCYAVTAPGLAPLAATELRGLGLHPGRTDRGGVAFRAAPRGLYAANAWLRTATRVLVRLGSYTARNFDELQRGADALDWSTVAVPGAPLHLRVTSSRSTLYHTDAIAERLAAVWGAPLVSASEDPTFEAPLLVVRVHRDRVTVSADSSGLPLYRRGWQVTGGVAPLRETLAAALLAAIGWDGSVPLLDPLCGAGTIPIEAARLAAGLPPSLDRRYTFQRWASFEPGTWASVAGELQAARDGARPAKVPIVGSDHDPQAIDAALANAEAAGVADLVTLSQRSLAEVTSPATTGDERQVGWLLTNPPYGKRVGGPDLRTLYASVGNLLRGPLAGWSAALLGADEALVRHTGLALTPGLRTVNGGIDVTLWRTPGADSATDGPDNA